MPIGEGLHTACRIPVRHRRPRGTVGLFAPRSRVRSSSGTATRSVFISTATFALESSTISRSGSRAGLKSIAYRADTSIEERARYDNQYVEHWSLWRDVVILIRTVQEVVRSAGR
jgi:Bacterial sugar transferase